MAAQRQALSAIYGMLRARMPGSQAKILATAIDNLKQDVDAINTAVNAAITAQNALATALNTLATKLNADAGVTDTNYVATNPTNTAGTGV
jgi:hypothetical protein